MYQEHLLANTYIFYTAPRNIVATFAKLAVTVGKGKDVRLSSKVTTILGNLFLTGFPINLYQGSFEIPVDNLAGLDSLEDFVFNASTTGDDSEITSNLILIETDL